MKNLAKENPSNLTVRLLAAASFVDKDDIKGKSILDIGCGYGWFESYALENGVRKIVGTEIAVRDLVTAKKYIKDKRASFVVTGATKLPFKSGSFDTIVCWEVIEHIPKNTENIMFQEVFRVLKKGGKFYLSTPFASWQSILFDPAWWLTGHRHYSINQIKNYATKNKFKILKINLRGKWFAIFSSLDMYISKWVFRRGPIMAEMFEDKAEKEYSGFKNIYICLKSNH